MQVGLVVVVMVVMTVIVIVSMFVVVVVSMFVIVMIVRTMRVTVLDLFFTRRAHSHHFDRDA